MLKRNGFEFRIVVCICILTKLQIGDNAIVDGLGGVEKESQCPVFVGVCLYRPKKSGVFVVSIVWVNSIDSCKPQLDRVFNLVRNARVYGWCLNVVGHNTVLCLGDV